MDDQITVGRSAARVLAARSPGWMVWYGEHTGRYWAVPLTATRLHACLIEAGTPTELEQEIRRYQGETPGGPHLGHTVPRHRIPQDAEPRQEPVTVGG